MHSMLNLFSNLIKGLLKIVDLGLYVGDIYSDIGFTILLYNNCHYNYFVFSLSTFFISYLTTVVYLRLIVNYPEKSWKKAMLYPWFTMGIIVGKFSAIILGKVKTFQI